LQPRAGGSPWSRWTPPHRSLANVGGATTRRVRGTPDALPQVQHKRAHRNKGWKLDVNANNLTCG
jgi:hypothetical protein